MPKRSRKHSSINTALQESKKKFRIIFENTIDGILVADATTKQIILANPATEHITGYSPKEITRLSVCDIHPKESLPFVLEQFTKQVRGEFTLAQNTPILRKDKRIAYCDINTKTMTLGKRKLIIGIFRDVTEQKNIEARYHSLFENMYSGVAVYEAVDDGQDFIFKDFNATAEKIEHLQREQLLGKRVTEVFPGVEKLGLFKVFQHVWETGELGYLPPALYSDERFSGWRENWVYKLPNDEIVAIYNDVTATKQIEETLRTSETRFHNLFENAPIGIFEFDFSATKSYLFEQIIPKNSSMVEYLEAHPRMLQTVISKVKINDMNQAALEFSGAPSKTDFITFFPKLLTDQTKHAIAQLLAVMHTGQTRFELETSMLTMDGIEKYLFARYIVVPGYEDTCSKVIITIVDITEQKQYSTKLETRIAARTQALKESEQRYKLLSAISPVGIFHLDAKGNCLYVNQEFTKITGLTAEEAYVDGGWEKVIHPEDLLKTRKAWYQSVAENKHFKDKYRFCKPNGEITWVLGQSIALYNKNQNITGHVGTLTDITEQQRAEEKIRLQNQQLARIERASAINEVASSLAHQLNQPLTVISSYAQMLSQCNCCPKTCDKANKIVTYANHASAIIHNMRDFLSGGSFAKQNTNINTLVTDTLKLCIPDHTDAHYIHLDLVSPAPETAINKVQIEQVVLNLVQNAMEVLMVENQQNREITIRTHTDDGMLTITVEDNGPGFTPTMHDKLFEPFFTTKSQGMGIGLSVCRSIVEAHGGQLYAENLSPKGAKFYFTLPMASTE